MNPQALFSPQLGRRGALENVDWSFAHREKADAIEGIHPYPAKFIGEIPRAFLNAIGVPPGTAVLDPFCGSGTTLVEAQRLGYPSIGIDLNPIACLVARVKTQPLMDGFLEAVKRLTAESRVVATVRVPEIPNLDHWFKKDVQQAVARISEAIRHPQYESWFDALRLTLSSILVRVSNQDSDTRYAAIDKGLAAADVYSAFEAASQKLDRALKSRQWSVDSSARVLQANTLEVTPEDIPERIGLVITSPPYPNAYEYWLYHKYRMWWLGFDPLQVKESEIGARAHFFKKNRHTAEHFADQMQKTFDLINGKLVSGGHICVVVGRSKIHGVIVDNGDLIEHVGASLDLSLLTRIERPISSHRKSFNLSHANIKTESVLVFQKT